MTARLRMPFYLLPGDLLFLAPLFRRAGTIRGHGRRGSERWVDSWQSGLATKVGRFQLVLGRELGVTFYGLSGDDRVLALVPRPVVPCE
jgi:hypothetical protein